MAITEFDLTTYVLMQDDVPLAVYTDAARAMNVRDELRATTKKKRDRMAVQFSVMGVPMNPLKKPEVL